MPAENVATVAACASVVEGVSRSRNALLNGDTRNYDWDSGYTCHQLGSGAIVIQLAQPFTVSSLRYAREAAGGGGVAGCICGFAAFSENLLPMCFRLLLWDCDERSYSYYIEVSTNQQQWTKVVDRTRVACRWASPVPPRLWLPQGRKERRAER